MSFEIKFSVSLSIVTVVVLNLRILLSKIYPNSVHIHFLFQMLNVFPEVKNFCCCFTHTLSIQLFWRSKIKFIPFTFTTFSRTKWATFFSKGNTFFLSFFLIFWIRPVRNFTFCCTWCLVTLPAYFIWKIIITLIALCCQESLSFFFFFLLFFQLCFFN